MCALSQDAHVGNYYFEEDLSSDGREGGGGGEAAVVGTKAGLYDFQCVAQEHPMRDVVYHCMSSVGDDVLREMGGDQQLLRLYLRHFG